MNKILGFVFTVLSLMSFGQLSPRNPNIIQNATTDFGVTVPIGSMIYNAETGKYYFFILSALGSDDINSCISGSKIKEILPTTGTAAKATILETTRSIYGNNFDGSADLTGDVTIGDYNTSTDKVLKLNGRSGYKNTIKSFRANSEIWNIDFLPTDAINFTYTPSSKTVLTILNTGYIGIGTTAPTTNMEVVGGIKASTNIDLGDYLRFTGTTPTIYTSGYTNSLKIDASNILLNSACSGKVGIGTSAPASLLQVAGLATLGSLKVGSYNVSVTGDCSIPQSGSMTYPGAGIGVSTGSSWGTSIAESSLMHLAGNESVTGIKTFDASTLKIKTSLGGDAILNSSGANGASTTYNFPAGGGDVLINSTAQAITGAKTFDASTLALNASSTYKLYLNAATGSGGGMSKTLTIPWGDGTLAWNDQTMYLGTTGVAINRGSGALSLAGVSIDGSSASCTGNAGGTSAGLAAQYIDWSASSGGTSIKNKPTIPAAEAYFGTVTSITTTAPISGGTITGSGTISMAAATASVNGYMTSTYAGKLDGIAAGATNVTNTNQLTNGAGFITSSGTAAACTGNAGGTSTGLSAQYIDWNTTSTGTSIKNKPSSMPASDVYTWAKASAKPSYTYSEVGAQVAGTYVTGVTATAPVYSSGGTAPAISMSSANSGRDGYMTSTYAGKLDGIASGATNVTNTNQLTNGAGFITSSGTAAACSGNSATATTAYATSTTTIPGSDHTVSGDVISLTANANSAIGDVIYISSTGKAKFCDATDIGKCPYALAICAVASITANAAGNWLTKGTIRDDTWNWTVGSLIYISTTATTGNTLTQTAPSGVSNVVMPVGVALSADVMYFFGNINSVEHQ